MKHLFIINPIAGGMKGHYEKTEGIIKEFTETLEDHYEIYVTKGPMDACRKIIEEADKMEKADETEKLYVYACGGDGTLNECANGAANRKNVALTHYPCGTGNDFLKTFGRENVNLFLDLKELSNGTIRALDLIDCDGRYAINISSVGIDARVGADVHKYSGIPLIGGKSGYIVSLIVNIIKGVKQKFKITIDETVIDKYITLACICNGKFYGGGFNPVPEAVPDDGILEILVVKAVSRLKLSSIVSRYAQGRFREFPELFTYIRGNSMEIECDRKFVINIDGEAIFAKKISFKLVEKSINFIFPPKLKDINVNSK
ncbi:MAG: diacylglycerol kinase family lipid kinase [Oscillospiraceae bacterium]|jgi:YegS/Rv2252/BmrU family lipid kinase|nr:diacylglycerol kinase family lipid kinase [Oscillospiraceae bacterium]